MAYKTLVYPIPGSTDGTPFPGIGGCSQSSISNQTFTYTPPGRRYNLPHWEIIRQKFLCVGYDADTVDIILSSWRFGTKKTYHTYLKTWVDYASVKEVPVVNPTTTQALSFLSSLVKKGCSYNQLNIARSVMSLLIGQSSEGTTWGELPIVRRFMKGHFENDPLFPKFYYTWDVSTVFEYFRGLPRPAELPLDLLTKKLCLLLVLLSGGQRSQTIHTLQVTDFQIVGNTLVMPIMAKIKQTRSGRHMHPLGFRVYTQNEKLCVVTHLTWYLKRTSVYRKDKNLFLSYIKPHRAAGKDTIARWCKSVLSVSGINTDLYSSHSSRSAATSSAKRKGISLTKLTKCAGWSSEWTFALYYDKNVEDESTFQDFL